MKSNSNIEAPIMAQNSNPMMPMDNSVQMNPMQNNMPIMDNSYEVGGQTNKGNIFKGFFNDINILDVMLSAFIVGGILYVVYYYKHQMAKDKTIYTDLDTRLSTIEKQVKKVNSELNATGKNKKRNVVRL
jgi:type IV secretory pathway VirB6-like protein